jgi:kynurenine formamidase
MHAVGRMTRETNWGRWGPDDERGALNLLTAETVASAARLVRSGRVFQLGLPIQANGVPRVGHRAAPLHLMARDGGDYAAGAIAPDDVGVADDYVTMATHGSTHVDALSHIWYGGSLYNGFSSNEVRSSGAARNGIDKIPPIVGRGVLLDVAALHGREHLEGGHAIEPDELDRCLLRQQVEVGPADILLVRTGWFTVFARDRALYDGPQPGLSASTVPWLADRDVVAVGADNYAVERFPDAAGRNVPLHLSLIRDYGVHLIELLMLEDLAAAGVSEFLFIAAPLRITRGVGSPLNPLAIA